MTQNYLAAATALVEGLACDVAATHGKLAQTVAGVSNDVMEKVAPDGFKLVFGMAAFNNLLSTFNTAFVKHDVIGTLLNSAQLGINTTQSLWGIQEVVQDKSKNWGIASTILSGTSLVLKLVGFWHEDGVSRKAQLEALKSSMPAVAAGDLEGGQLHTERSPLLGGQVKINNPFSQ